MNKIPWESWEPWFEVIVVNNQRGVCKECDEYSNTDKKDFDPPVELREYVKREAVLKAG